MANYMNIDTVNVLGNYTTKFHKPELPFWFLGSNKNGLDLKQNNHSKFNFVSKKWGKDEEKPEGKCKLNFFTKFFSSGSLKKGGRTAAILQIKQLQWLVGHSLSSSACNFPKIFSLSIMDDICKR